MKKILILILLLLPLLLLTPGKIYGAEEINGPDVIYKQSDKVLTMTTIKSLYSYDTGTIEVLEDNYTGYGNISGIYDVKLGVASTAFTKDIQISVRKTIGDVIAVTQINDAYTIHMYKNKSLTLNEVVKVLENVQYIVVTSTTEIQILTDTYTDNYDSPGLYVFEFYLANTSGFESEYTVNIKVNNSEKLLPDILVVDDRTAFWSNLGSIATILASGAILLVALLFVMKYSNKRKGKRGLI